MRPIALLTLTITLAACAPTAPPPDIVVFSSGRTGNGDLYAVDWDGGAADLLVGTEAGEGAPRWDPSGGRLVHSRFDSTGANLYSGDSLLFRDPNGDVAPVWSVDGRVAYVREGDGQADVFTAAADGSAETPVTDDHLIERYPAWDPTGSRIVYAKLLDSGWDLHVLTLPTGSERRITFDGVYVGHPSWSPDGGAIAFDRMFGDQTEIVILTLDDLGTTRITDNGGNDLLPSWSSDGSRLVFAGERDGNWDVWLHVLADGIERRLTDDPAFDGGPIFVPGTF